MVEQQAFSAPAEFGDHADRRPITRKYRAFDLLDAAGLEAFAENLLEYLTQRGNGVLVPPKLALKNGV